MSSVQDYMSKKLYLDDISADIGRLTTYINKMNERVSEMNRYWQGGRDRNIVFQKILSHLQKVNALRANLHRFQQTSLFLIGKLDEMGSLEGITPPSGLNLSPSWLFNVPATSSRIEIDTGKVDEQARLIAGHKSLINESYGRICRAQDFIDNILNLFGLNTLLASIDCDMRTLMTQNDNIASGIKRICNRYNDAENKVKTKAKQLSGTIGTAVQQVAIAAANAAATANKTKTKDLTQSKVKLTSDLFVNEKYEYDSITIDGKTVPAYADERLYRDYWVYGKGYGGDFADGSPHYNNCAEFVARLYREVWGIMVNGLIPGQAPNNVVKTTSPNVGDIVAFPGHWAIVKSVNGNGTITLIEQQWHSGSGDEVYVTVNRTISVDEPLAYYTRP